MDVLSEGGRRWEFVRRSLFFYARQDVRARQRGVMYDADYDDAAAAAAAAAERGASAVSCLSVCALVREEERSVISLSRVQDLPR